MLDEASGLADETSGLVDEASGLVDEASGLADEASGLAGETSGLADEASGLAGETSGLADEASGLADETSGLADEASGLADEASGLADEASGLADEASGLVDEASGLADEASGLADEASGLKCKNGNPRGPAAGERRFCRGAGKEQKFYGGCPSEPIPFVVFVTAQPCRTTSTPIMSTETTPYMLLFHDSSPDRYKNLSPEQTQQFLTKWNAWYEGLAAKGKLDHGRPLEPEGRVVSGTRGERVVDGPFAESKEAIAGYFLLMVSDLDEATEIARQCPGLEHGMAVEVRPVANCCPIKRATERQAAPELAAV